MFYRLSQKLSDQFESHGIISSDDKELYSYGLRQGFTILLNIFTVSLIGLILSEFVECFVYLIAYSVLRVFAGGYHARTPLRCYFFFVTMATACFLVIKYLAPGDLICCILFLLSSFGVLFLAPVEDRNKPLDKAEQTVYRQRTLILVMIEGIAFWFSAINHIKFIYIPIMLALTSLSVLMVAGCIKNRRDTSNNKE